MVDGKLLHRIVVWPTYEDAAAAEEVAASEDCKRSSKLTVWQTYEQAAAHTNIGGGGVTVPVNTVLPVISGTAEVDETLTSTTGTWTGGGSITYAYQWMSDGSNVGANQNTYVPVVGDIGLAITVEVTAANAAGSDSATSLPTANIGAGGGGGELPVPPEGFHYLINADGKFIVNADGAYILVDGD